MIDKILHELTDCLIDLSKVNKFEVHKFKSYVLDAFGSNKALGDCYPQTIISAIRTCAEFGLYPNSHHEQCLLYAEYGRCRFYMQYKGLIHVMYSTMDIEMLDTQIIYKNDEFKYTVSPKLELIHSPNILDQGERIGVYAKCVIGGSEFVEVLSKDKVGEIADMSKSKFWEEKNDPNGWMWRKTAIKQMAKKVPSSSLLSLTLKVDNEIEGGKNPYVKNGEIEFESADLLAKQDKRMQTKEIMSITSEVIKKKNRI